MRAAGEPERIAGMTRREVAFLVIGLGFSGIVGSFISAYQYARYISDWHGLDDMFDAMRINENVFIIPAVVLAAGLVLLIPRKKIG